MQRDLVVEFQGDHFAHAGGGFEFGQAAVQCDAMLEVHDEVAFDQLGEIEQLVDLGWRGDRAAVEGRAPLPLAA